MEISEIFERQDLAARSNIQQFQDEFHWCHNAIQLMVDTHEFLASDPNMIVHRDGMRNSDRMAFQAMNVVVNLAYDALGSLISALRLMQYGALADAWSLIRGAFESTCYAEFFALNKNKVNDYLEIAEKIKSNRSSDVRDEIRQAALQLNKVMQFLEKRDGEHREGFYARLSNFGTHASPVRSGLRIKVNEPEVCAYLSIGHRELIQCLADFAATAKYTLGIPFDAWRDLMQSKRSLSDRYESLLEGYKVVYDPA